MLATTADKAVRLSVSRVDANGDVAPAPADLLVQAQRFLPSLDMDTYALARVVASEFGNGSEREQLAIAASDWRRSGGAVLRHCIGKALTFGRQGSRRPVATSQDPTRYHALIARAAMSGEGAADFGGAIQYFDAVSQLALWQQGKAMHPEVVLERWTYNKAIVSTRNDAQGRRVVTLGAAQSGGVQWIGARDGVRPQRLMLFEPARADTRDARFVAARAALSAASVPLLPFALGVLLCVM